MKYYKAVVPFIRDMGTISPLIVSESGSESKEKNLLWELNSMREHDCLPRLRAIPEGTRFYPHDYTLEQIKASEMLEELRRNNPSKHH